MVRDPAAERAEAVVKRSGLVLAVAVIAVSPGFEARCTDGFGRGLRGVREGLALCSLGPARGAVGGLEVSAETQIIREGGPTVSACCRGRGCWWWIGDLGEEAAIHRVAADGCGPGLVGIEDAAGELEEAVPGEEGVSVLRASEAHYGAHIRREGGENLP
jgi:hypothetical protein